MTNEESSTPEFDIFKRLEKLEETSVTKPALDDIFMVARMAFGIAFANIAVARPKQARKQKDSIIKWAKSLGVSKGILEDLESLLLIACEEAEK